MESVDPDAPQAKARRQQKEHSLEHCQGYVDKNGMWNNGFYCPRWGGPEDNYCCGDGSERFCCPEPITDLVTSSTTPNSSDAAFNFIPIVIGISVGLFVFMLGLVIACFVCPCCPGRHARTRKRSSSGQTTNAVRRTLSVSLEAEATSAVIAAQALVPLQGCQISPAPSSSTATDDVHLHCGCRWSPSTSRSTVVDVDMVPGSIYQNSPAGITWQTELDNMYNCSCEKALLNDSKTLRAPSDHLYQMLAASGRHQSSSGSSSPMCLDSLRSGASSRCPPDDHYHHHHHHRLLNPHLRGVTSSEVQSQQPHQQSSPRCHRMYGAVISGGDIDRQRRDSGVLIEDGEQGEGDFSATAVMPMPSLVVERIGRAVTSR